MFKPFVRQFNGLNKDEKLFLEMKKQKEGKNYAQAKYEVRKTLGQVIRTELKTKADSEQYKETHKNETFKENFKALRAAKRNRD